jgi:hypothetical protein
MILPVRRQARYFAMPLVPLRNQPMQWRWRHGRVLSLRLKTPATYVQAVLELLHSRSRSTLRLSISVLLRSVGNADEASPQMMHPHKSKVAS